MKLCSVKSCGRTVRTKGLCSGHYKRTFRTSTIPLEAPIVDRSSPIMDRLHLKSVLVPMCGCRIWFGASVPYGYGVISYNGRQTYTHRVAWELAHGQIPSGMFVMHRCDTPACINVDHLSVGTPADNTYDMVRKNRAAGGAPKGFKHPNPAKRGSLNPAAKLTNQQVDEIRTLYSTKQHKQSDIAHMFSVRQCTIVELTGRTRSGSAPG